MNKLRKFTGILIGWFFNRAWQFKLEYEAYRYAEEVKSTGRGFTFNNPLYVVGLENIEVGDNVYVNSGAVILAYDKIVLGAGTIIGPSVMLTTANHDYSLTNDNMRATLIKKPISIGKNCWIGGKVSVLPGVEIGDDCVIGAGSVVVRSIPANSVAVGNPCRVIKPRFNFNKNDQA